MIRLNETAAGVSLAVRVQPRASRTMIRGEIDGALKIALAAPPVDGEANEELVRFLARLCAIPRQSVTIISGQTSRQKVVVLEGMTRDGALARLAPDDRADEVVKNS